VDLCIDVPRFDSGKDCNANLVRVLELLLVCAVQSEERSSYISAVQALDTGTQEQLMMSISQNMEGYLKPPVQEHTLSEIGSPGLIQEDAVQELQIKAGRVECENEALKNEMALVQKEITSIKDEKATLEDESSTVAKHVSSSQLRPEGAMFGYQWRRASAGVYGQDLLQRQRD
jgi:hypothetical protein